MPIRSSFARALRLAYPADQPSHLTPGLGFASSRLDYYRKTTVVSPSPPGLFSSSTHSSLAYTVRGPFFELTFAPLLIPRVSSAPSYHGINCKMIGNLRSPAMSLLRESKNTSFFCSYKYKTQNFLFFFGVF